MKDNWQKLDGVVSEMVELLRNYHVLSWADKLDQVNQRIVQRGAEGPAMLLKLYGGMGSLNDIYICPENNHSIGIEDVQSVNNKLSRLTSDAYALAKNLECGQ